MRLLSTLLIGVSLLPGSLLYAHTPDVESETRNLLDAYAREDAKSVLAFVDDGTVIYGSDASEVFDGVAAIRQMLSNDARLWSGTAHIGDMQNVTVVRQGGLESIFFQAPFTVGKRPPVTVRFCMIWRRKGKRWLLLQSSNAVVTQHQSAAELLGAH